jgi:hypothetical protein
VIAGRDRDDRYGNRQMPGVSARTDVEYALVFPPPDAFSR